MWTTLTAKKAFFQKSLFWIINKVTLWLKILLRLMMFFGWICIWKTKIGKNWLAIYLFVHLLVGFILLFIIWLSNRLILRKNRKIISLIIQLHSKYTHFLCLLLFNWSLLSFRSLEFYWLSTYWHFFVFYVFLYLLNIKRWEG